MINNVYRSNEWLCATIDGKPMALDIKQYPSLYDEVEAYLLDHPEALVQEPVPPEPTQEELDAMEVQTAKSYLASTDWIVAKIGEAQMKGLDIEALLEKYSVEFTNRDKSRSIINELDK